MAQQPPAPGSKVPAENDLYTFLLIAAAGLLFGGTIFLIVKTAQLFGSVFPPAGG